MKNIYLVLMASFVISCGNETKEKNEANTAQQEEVTSEKKADESKAGTQENLIKWEEDWAKGIDSLKNFVVFGLPEKNKIVEHDNPNGKITKVWECIPGEKLYADGGWDTNSIFIDRNFSYRYTVWVKRAGGLVGKTLHGPKNVQSTLNEKVANPYFIEGRPPQTDQWYLLVGYIHPFDYVDPNGGVGNFISGIYDEFGDVVVEGEDFKWTANATYSAFRTYLNNSNDNVSERQYLYSPELYRIDGTEPTLESYFEFK